MNTTFLVIFQLPFPLNRTPADTMTRYEKHRFVDKQGHVSVKTKAGDYSSRAGVTRRPMTRRNLHNVMPVTHAKMRAMGHVLRVCYRFVIPRLDVRSLSTIMPRHLTGIGQVSSP